jgi:hypothetical protein
VLDSRLESNVEHIRHCVALTWQVRRNAVLAIYTIFKNFEHLIPDAPELIQNVLEVEQVWPLSWSFPSSLSSFSRLLQPTHTLSLSLSHTHTHTHTLSLSVSTD